MGLEAEIGVGLGRVRGGGGEDSERWRQACKEVIEMENEDSHSSKTCTAVQHTNGEGWSQQQ